MPGSKRSDDRVVDIGPGRNPLGHDDRGVHDVLYSAHNRNELTESKMKTPDLMEHVATAAGLDKPQAKAAVDSMIAGIVKAARKGDEVILNGFGKFKVRDTPARQGRNPSTGESMDIQASRKLSFSPAKQLKDAVAN